MAPPEENNLLSQELRAAEAEAAEFKDELFHGELPDSTESNLRFLAYGARLRPLFLASTRYLAYTSDVGEAFRPIVNPTAVKAAYGISWLYLGGDVAYEGYKHSLKETSTPSSTTLALVKRATFQGTASMLFPALTIHSTVKYSGPLFKRIQNPKIRGWGPTVAGLAVVPFLPYIFDKPIEHAVDWGFEKLEPLVTTHSGPVREDVSSEKKDL